MQEVNIEPGGRSGWHHHPGIVIVAVTEGLVTFVDGADCSATTYGPGSPNDSVFVESGDERGEARNMSTDQPAKAYATFVVPDEDPGVFRVEDARVTCPNATAAAATLPWLRPPIAGRRRQAIPESSGATGTGAIAQRYERHRRRQAKEQRGPRCWPAPTRVE